jgi:hypothetical protein
MAENHKAKAAKDDEWMYQLEDIAGAGSSSPAGLGSQSPSTAKPDSEAETSPPASTSTVNADISLDAWLRSKQQESAVAAAMADAARVVAIGIAIASATARRVARAAYVSNGATDTTGTTTTTTAPPPTRQLLAQGSEVASGAGGGGAGSVSAPASAAGATVGSVAATAGHTARINAMAGLERLSGWRYSQLLNQQHIADYWTSVTPAMTPAGGASGAVSGSASTSLTRRPPDDRTPDVVGGGGNSAPPMPLHPLPPPPHLPVSLILGVVSFVALEADIALRAAGIRGVTGPAAATRVGGAGASFGGSLANSASVYPASPSVAAPIGGGGSNADMRPSVGDSGVDGGGLSLVCRFCHGLRVDRVDQ